MRLHFACKNFDEDSEAEDKDAEAEARVQFIPSLYLPSGWQPPPAPDDAEHVMSKFDKKLDARPATLSTLRFEPIPTTTLPW
jgi:hypothetical protein